MTGLVESLVTAVAPPGVVARAGRAISTAELTSLLDAARTAPSGVNGQTWRFVVVAEAERRARLAEAVPPGLAPAVAGAHLLVVVCGVVDRMSRRDLDIPFAAIDVPNALTHLLLAAADVGVPHAWTLEVRDGPCRAELHLPPEVRVTAMVALG